MKKKGEPCPGYLTLCLGRVGWPSSPASHKYKGRTRKKKKEEEDFF